MTMEMCAAKLELRELADSFATLSDTGAAEALSELFTPDGVLEFQIGFNGELNRIRGREDLLAAFRATLTPDKKMFHLSGQHTVKLNEDLTRAEGIAYCQASFLTEENGVRQITTNNIRYSDSYVKAEGKWFIQCRRSTFLITETRNVAE